MFGTFLDTIPRGKGKGRKKEKAQDNAPSNRWNKPGQSVVYHR